MKHLIDQELTEKLGVGSFKSPLIYDEPISMGKEAFSKVERQSNIIQDFFAATSNIAQRALRDNDESLIRLLFSENNCGLNDKFHKELPENCWEGPVFYRTDQSLSGKIYEIQGPGSGWGDLFLLAKCYKERGKHVDPLYYDFPQKYAKIIADVTGKERPKVFHMIDAASVPHSMRYLMAITSKYVSYWGMDSDTAMDNVDFVTAHSVYSLTASNFFKSYLQRSKRGELVFGLPPNILFDEKVLYALPFHRLTRDLYSDEIRSLFPFTTVIEDNGFYDEDGVFCRLDKLEKAKRVFYLKYGGPDISRNWGSRSVFRIKARNSDKLLNMASDLSKKGEVWLLQEDVSKEYPQNLSSDLNKLVAAGNHIKVSAYYGKKEFLGIKMMARHHFKVHGQVDTVISLGIE